jgi:hypothetical protein
MPRGRRRADDRGCRPQTSRDGSLLRSDGRARKGYRVDRCHSDDKRTSDHRKPPPRNGPPAATLGPGRPGRQRLSVAGDGRRAERSSRSPRRRGNRLLGRVSCIAPAAEVLFRGVGVGSLPLNRVFVDHVSRPISARLPPPGHDHRRMRRHKNTGNRTCLPFHRMCGRAPVSWGTNSGCRGSPLAVVPRHSGAGSRAATARPLACNEP